MELRIGSKYRIKKRIGAGSFGEIYSGENVNTHEEVAIKLESVRTRPPQLSIESKIYRVLAGGVGVPSVKWYGVEGDYNVLVMELLGKSIEDLFTQCQRKFSLKTVLMLADQLLLRIEYIHDKGLIHRDIKPDNFTVGLGSASNEIYTIDYGLSKKYRDPRTHQHIPYREGKSLTGTARYSSINTHLGIEQSRRDDVEGIAYILIYFLKGSLPWMGLHAENRKQKYEAIAEKKIATPIEQLCAGIPQEFAIFLNSTRKLDFLDRPDYAEYRRMFRELFIREGFVYDYKYDWVLRNQAAPSNPFWFASNKPNDEQIQNQQPQQRQNLHSQQNQTNNNPQQQNQRQQPGFNPQSRGQNRGNMNFRNHGQMPRGISDIPVRGVSPWVNNHQKRNRFGH